MSLGVKGGGKSFAQPIIGIFLFFYFFLIRCSSFSITSTKRQTTMLRNILFYVSLFLSTSTTVHAFSVVTANTRSSPTQLSVSTTTHFVLDSECLLEAEYCMPFEQQQQRQTKRLSFRRQHQQQQQPATWMDLPARHSGDTESSVDLELQLGRTAMIIAALLLTTELITGQSLALLGQ